MFDDSRVRIGAETSEIRVENLTGRNLDHEGN